MSTYASYPVDGSGGGGNLPSQVLADTEAVSNGATDVDVTFGTAFAQAPSVVAWLSSSDASPIILSIIGIDVTTAGFTANLSAAAPNGNYSLNWVASAVNN